MTDPPAADSPPAPTRRVSSRTPSGRRPVGRRAWSLLSLAACLVLLASALGLTSSALPRAQATSAFAAQTGKECVYCHATPGGPLTPEGQAFHDAGDVLPDDPASPGSTVDGDGPPDTTAGGTDGSGSGDGAGPGSPGDGAPRGPLLPLPGWLHDLVLWAHLVSMTTWLGAIVFVHVVQTPRIAGQGIPRGYLRLAWPAIGTLGGSGLLLTLGIIPSLSTLVEGRWGLLLLTKIALFLVLASVAAVATFIVSPRLRRLAEGAGSAGGHDAYRAQGRVTLEYGGRVFDVTSSRLWRNGRHARRHDAWQDLTGALGGAPHGPEVFEGFPELTGANAGTPRPVRAFILLAYGNLSLVMAVLLIVALW